MNKPSRILLAAAALLTSTAYAQGNPFEGWSLGLNMSLQSNTTELNAGTDRFSSLGWTSQGANLQASYGWPTSASSVFSVGVNYSLTDASGGDASTAVGAFSLKRKNAYSVYFEPGLKLSDTTLAYFKVGYEGTTLREDTSLGGMEKTLDGAGYGFGLRGMLDKHVYLQAEVKQLFYNTANFPGQATGFKLTGTEGLLGLGYQF